MLTKFLSTLQNAYFKKIGVDASKIVFANGSKPLLFSNNEIPVIGGLYYCSCLFLEPKVKRKSSISAAVHVEAVSHDIADYKIANLIDRVQFINDCDGVNVRLYGRHFMSSSTLSNYSSQNLISIQDELFKIGVSAEDIKIGSAYKNNILVNGSIESFPESLYNTMYLRANRQPTSSFSPNGYSHAYSNELLAGPSINSYGSYSNSERVNINNIYDCSVGVLRSSDSDKFVIFHVNHIFDYDKSEDVIKNSIASIFNSCKRPHPKVNAEIYSRHFENSFIADANLDSVRSSLVANSMSYGCVNGFSSSITIDSKSISEAGILDGSRTSFR